MLSSPAELEVGAEAFGVNSSSPDWIHECEVRFMAMLQPVDFNAYVAGIKSKRGEEASLAIKAEAEERKVMMEMLRLSHPRIDMKIAQEIMSAESQPKFVPTPAPNVNPAKPAGRRSAFGR